jgi:hypothetical protein
MLAADILEKIASDAFNTELEKLSFPKIAPIKPLAPKIQPLQNKNSQKLSDSKHMQTKPEQRRNISSSNRGLSTMADSRMYKSGPGGNNIGMRDKHLSI